MRTRIRPGRDLTNWFEYPVSRLALSHLRETAVFVAPSSDILGWISTHRERPLPGESGDLVQALLENVVTVNKEQGADEHSDFVLLDKPGELSEVLNSPMYEERLRWRRASPFLEGEGTSAAFSRLFGDLLLLAQDWQIIDSFLLEQIMRRDSVWNFMSSHIESFPPEVEIYSRSPHYELRNSLEARNAIRELESLFRDHGKELVIHSFFPPGGINPVSFPHPRLQKIRFRRGDVFSSLDNGLNSLVLDGPSVFSIVSSKEWSDAQAELKLMRVNTLTKY